MGKRLGSEATSRRVTSQSRRAHGKNPVKRDGGESQNLGSQTRSFRTCVKVGDLGCVWESQHRTQNSRRVFRMLGSWLAMLGPCLEFHACLANYSLIGCQDVALILGAVSWCLKGWPRTPEPRDWLGFPQTHTQAGKVGLGVGLDCQTDTRAHTPPSKAPLPPEQRKASF